MRILLNFQFKNILEEQMAPKEIREERPDELVVTAPKDLREERPDKLVATAPANMNPAAIGVADQREERQDKPVVTAPM